MKSERITTNHVLWRCYALLDERSCVGAQEKTTSHIGSERKWLISNTLVRDSHWMQSLRVQFLWGQSHRRSNPCRDCGGGDCRGAVWYTFKIFQTSAVRRGDWMIRAKAEDRPRIDPHCPMGHRWWTDALNALMFGAEAQELLHMLRAQYLMQLLETAVESEECWSVLGMTWRNHSWSSTGFNASIKEWLIIWVVISQLFWPSTVVCTYVISSHASRQKPRSYWPQ